MSTVQLRLPLAGKLLNEVKPKPLADKEDGGADDTIMARGGQWSDQYESNGFISFAALVSLSRHLVRSITFYMKVTQTSHHLQAVASQLKWQSFADAPQARHKISPLGLLTRARALQRRREQREHNTDCPGDDSI